MGWNEIEVVVVPRALFDDIKGKPFAELVADSRLIHVPVKRRYPGIKADPDKGIKEDLYESLDLGPGVVYMRPSEPGEFGRPDRGAVSCVYFQGWTA